MFRQTGHPEVDAIGQLRITGNVTPQSWYQHIRYSNKRGNYPDLLAIAILSDIVYWYRPFEVRDETAIHVVSWRKKFKADKLQRSPDAFVKLYGVSLKQVRESLQLLQELGLIDIELRSIKTSYGTIPRTMFIGLNPCAIAQISYQLNPETLEKSLLPNSVGRGAELGNKGCRIGQQGVPNWEPNHDEIVTLSIYRDYTENTKEITQTNTSPKPALAKECVCEEEDSTDESKDSHKEKTAKHSIDKAKPVSFEAESLRTQGKRQSRKPAQDSPFILWKKRIDATTWKAFINWKAQQAPSSVHDKLGWAYNTIKMNLERAQLSFESFQQEAQSQTQNTKLDATPDFKSWELAQHTELAQQYLAKGVLFLKEQPLHPKWVEFVQATMPTFFDEMQGVSE